MAELDRVHHERNAVTPPKVDIVERLRQVEQVPRPAFYNIGRRRKAIASEVERHQARHAGCSCMAYARPVIRSQTVESEVKHGHGREVREGAAQVGCARRPKACVAEAEVRHGREMREGREK